MIASTYEGLQEDFHVSHEVATRKRWLNSKVARLMARKVGLSLFVIGLCLGPCKSLQGTLLASDSVKCCLGHLGANAFGWRIKN